MTAGWPMGKQRRSGVALGVVAPGGVKVTVLFDIDQHAEVAALAEKHGTSFAEQVRTLIGRSDIVARFRGENQ